MAAAAEGAVDVPSGRTASASMASRASTGSCIAGAHSEKSSIPGGGVAAPASAWLSFADQTPASQSSK